MQLDRRQSAQDPHEPPERHERPDSFQKEESPLLLPPGEQRENGGADQIEDEVDARALVQRAELRSGVRDQDEQSTDDLSGLIHRASLTSPWCVDRGYC